jgi:3-oxoacyl-[acyl-carrier protein] reductase
MTQPTSSVLPMNDLSNWRTDEPLVQRAKFASFEKIGVGDEVQILKTIAAADLDEFARLSGDRNPLHMDAEFAGRTHFQRRVVHGMLLANYVSALVGMHCPGPGALWSQQAFRWPAPVFIGDHVLLTLKVKHKSVGTRTLTIEVRGVNQDGRLVMDGEGVVTALEDVSNKVEACVTEKVAFVSGGSRGIGAAICQALAEAGISVVVNYRRDENGAEEVCAGIRNRGGRALAIRADVTDNSSLTAAMQEAADCFKHSINILVNNAGSVPESQPFLQTTWDQIQTAIDTHVKGAYQCCQATIPGMIEGKWGRIINIGSSFAQSAPLPNSTAFFVAKAALQAMTRSLATELGPHGICVNTVSPGLLETSTFAGLSERTKKVQAMQTPLRRLATPSDVAAAVVALCGDAGRFVTGVELPVCGGVQM